MTTYQNLRSTRANVSGFTLVEVLVTITIIAILASMLSVAVSRALIRAREFTVQNEMMQLEAALEKFNIEYGFYPPSFKEFVGLSDEDAANRMLAYLGRISPNNAEATPISPDGPRRIDVWWNQVGRQVGSVNADEGPGADLVFWLSGLAKNKQFPLTYVDTNDFDNDGDTTEILGLAAHTYGVDAVIERQSFFEFEQSRSIFDATGMVASFGLGPGDVPFGYLDARNYLPTNPGSTDATDPEVIDGAYVFKGVTQEQVQNAVNDQVVFNAIYPNPDSFQLISFGLDGKPFGVGNDGELPPVPNDISRCGSQGADNFVNFGGEGITKLETVVLESN